MHSLRIAVHVVRSRYCFALYFQLPVKNIIVFHGVSDEKFRLLCVSSLVAIL